MTKGGGVYVLFLFVFQAVVVREFAVRLRLADPTKFFLAEICPGIQ